MKIKPRMEIRSGIKIKLGIKKGLTAVCVELQTVAQPFLELKFVSLISEICFVYLETNFI